MIKRGPASPSCYFKIDGEVRFDRGLMGHGFRIGDTGPWDVTGTSVKRKTDSEGCHDKENQNGVF